MPEFLRNKNIIIFIIIIVLLGFLYFANLRTTKKEHAGSCGCQKQSMDDTPSITQNTQQQNTQQIQEVKKDDPSKMQFKVFYTNWCGWSKKALAVLNSDEFKNEIVKINDKVELVLLDCEADSGKEQCESNNVRGFPTMILFKNNTPIEYNGDRTTSAIINFIKENF